MVQSISDLVFVVQPVTNDLGREINRDLDRDPDFVHAPVQLGQTVESGNIVLMQHRGTGWYLAMPHDGSRGRLEETPSRNTIIKLKATEQMSNPKGTRTQRARKLCYGDDISMLRKEPQTNTQLCLGKFANVLGLDHGVAPMWQLRHFHSTVVSKELDAVRGGSIIGLHNPTLGGMVGVAHKGRIADWRLRAFTMSAIGRRISSGSKNYDACLITNALRDDDYHTTPDGMKIIQTVTHSWMLWQVEVTRCLILLLVTDIILCTATGQV